MNFKFYFEFSALTIERDFGDEITENEANITGAASLAVAIGNIIGKAVCCLRCFFKVFKLKIAWLVVMLHCSRHPAISVYTTRTFGIIAFKYFQVLVFYSPIIIGFAVCFSVLFTKYADSYNELDDEEKLWTSIAMSLLKMLTMMAGDIESDGLFVEFRRLSSYYARVVAFTMFTLFFFFVSLVFINLLNAYAVANVQKIESMAETSNQINRIETVLFFERFIQTTLKALGPFGRRKWKKTFIVEKDRAIDKWVEVFILSLTNL